MKGRAAFYSATAMPGTTERAGRDRFADAEGDTVALLSKRSLRRDWSMQAMSRLSDSLTYRHTPRIYRGVHE